QPLHLGHAREPTPGHSYNRRMEESARHLRLLTDTIGVVNSTLDLEEVLSLVARSVAEALEADACFVYLYEDRNDELVLRATHGTGVDQMTRRPRLPPARGGRAPRWRGGRGPAGGGASRVPRPPRGSRSCSPRRRTSTRVSRRFPI